MCVDPEHLIHRAISSSELLVKPLQDYYHKKTPASVFHSRLQILTSSGWPPYLSGGYEDHGGFIWFGSSYSTALECVVVRVGCRV